MTHKPQKTRVAAYALIHQDARMLLCRLSKQLPSHAGYWTLPGGGIDFGEAPHDAVVREVWEETGLEVTVDAINDLVMVDSFYDEGESHDFHALRVIYRAKVVGGSLRDEIAGTTDTCAWLSLAEIAELPLVELAALGVHLCFDTSM